MGVGLEDSMTPWVMAQRADGLAWPQSIAIGKFENAGVRQAGIWATPNSYLIDRNGILLAINPTHAELVSILDSRLTQ